MIQIDEDEKTILITRGDEPVFNKLAFYLPIEENGQVSNYKFQLDDKISFVVHEKKGYTKPEIFRIEHTLRELGYTEETEYPEIPLTKEYTSCFEQLNKKSTYWYDLVLNDTTTILGYDEEGAKKIIVYPEAGERGDF